MSGGMLDAIRGCLKEEMRMDVISSNLANASVIGFKKDRISFQEVLGQTQTQGQANSGKPQAKDDALIRIKADQTQGDFRTTGNSLDLAIQGKGFFKVETPEGVQYTRRGNFTLGADGSLITQEGYKVLGAGGPLNISGEDINVSGQGIVNVDGSQVGQIQVVDFANYDGLVKIGNGLFRNSSGLAEVPAPAETKTEQGYLELSNVNIMEEMVGMIHSVRAFESYQKAIQTLDGLNQEEGRERGESPQMRMGGRKA